LSEERPEVRQSREVGRGGSELGQSGKRNQQPELISFQSNPRGPKGNETRRGENLPKQERKEKKARGELETGISEVRFDNGHGVRGVARHTR